MTTRNLYSFTFTHHKVTTNRQRRFSVALRMKRTQAPAVAPTRVMTNTLRNSKRRMSSSRTRSTLPRPRLRSLRAARRHQPRHLLRLHHRQRGQSPLVYLAELLVEPPEEPRRGPLPVPFFLEWMRQMELRQVLRLEPLWEDCEAFATAGASRGVDRYDRTTTEKKESVIVIFY